MVPGDSSDIDTWTLQHSQVLLHWLLHTHARTHTHIQHDANQLGLKTVTMETPDFSLESKSDIYDDHSYGLYQCASWEVSFYPEL